MGAGAKQEAIRLVSAANDLITSLDTAEPVAPDHRDRMARLLDHGMSRRVDHRIRQLHLDASAWSGLRPDRVEALSANEPGMLVVLGSHPDGQIRQASVELARSSLVPTDGSPRRKPPVGLTRMLAQRALDATPQVSAAARGAVAALFAEELMSEHRGRLPNGVERAAREIVAQTRSVTACPELVTAALDLFDSRTGRYSTTGVPDHHRHTLQEVDRREQVLAELQALLPDLTSEAAREIGRRLVDFYRRSLTPIRPDDHGSRSDPGPVGHELIED